MGRKAGGNNSPRLDHEVQYCTKLGKAIDQNILLCGERKLFTSLSPRPSWVEKISQKTRRKKVGLEAHSHEGGRLLS